MGLLAKAASTNSLLLDVAADSDVKKNTPEDDLNDARWFEHDIDIDENLDLDENINDRQIVGLDDEEGDEDGEEDEEEEEEDDYEEENSLETSQLSTTKSAPSQSPSRLLQMTSQNNSMGNRHLSLSLSNLPQASGIEELISPNGECASKSHAVTEEMTARVAEMDDRIESERKTPAEEDTHFGEDNKENLISG